MKTKFKQFLNENNQEFYTLYHGTHSGNLDFIKNNKTKLFLTTDEEVATYYAAKGGEDYFMDKEVEFEDEHGVTPDEYYDTQENGESVMFKALYPENEHPVVFKIEIPKELIYDIKEFYGYSGKEFLVKPEYIKDIIDIDWNDLEY